MKRLLIFAGLLVCSSLAWGTACPSGYGSWYKLFILPQASTTSNQTNFPMYFAGNPALATTANGGKSLNSGLDVTFCTGSNSGTLINYELVANTYTATTGFGEWWVLVPTVSYNTIETIYVGVGKTSANDSNVAGVWTAYSLVMHYGTASTLTLTDSSGTNTMTNNGSATAGTGEINGGMTLNGSSQYLSSNNADNPSGGMSWEAWTKPTATSSVYMITSNDATSVNGYDFYVYNGGVSAQLYGASGAYAIARCTSCGVTTGWNHIAATWNGSAPQTQGNWKLYVDGANQSFTIATNGTLSSYVNSSTNMTVGRNPGSTPYYWPGTLDEVRQYSGGLSADWIKDEYNNQSNPTSFYSFNWDVFNASSHAVANAQTDTLAFGTNNTAGNGLVVWGAGFYNGTFLGTSSSPSDTQGNTYAACSINNQTGGSATTSLWYVSNAKAGANTVTWNMAATGQYFVWGIAEVAVPGATGITCDQAVYASGSTTSLGVLTTATTGSLGSANEVAIGIGSVQNGGACGTPYIGQAPFIDLVASVCNSTTHYISGGVDFTSVSSTSAVTSAMATTSGLNLVSDSMFLATFEPVGTPTAATPTFTSSTASTVTITDSTTGSTIYYCQSATTCTPTVSSQTYSSSFAPIFPEVCAFVTATGYNPSAVACAALTAVSPSFSTQPSVLYSSPSSVAVTFATTFNVSVQGKCGTTTGGPYTAEVNPQVYTEGWERSSFTGTTTAWGTALAITGLHQNTTYYCIVVASDVTNTDTTNSSEFSATTATLSTVPVTVGATSQITRLNDQYNGANGMPNNGFWMNGDTEYETFADDGNYYGSYHDGTGVGGAYNQCIGLVTWNSTHTIATQLGGQLGFGGSGSCSNVGWSITDWEILGTQSVRGQIYMPFWANGGSSEFFNIIRTPDHWGHSLSAGHQSTLALGPLSPTASGVDVPVSPSILPNNGTGNSLFQAGQIFSCQDESMNCTPQANNDGYVYSWGNPVTSPNCWALSRVRVEDLPLLDGSKWQWYSGAMSADDGIYDANWTSTATSTTCFGGADGFTAGGINMGSAPMSQFIPDFNRYLYLNTIDNTYGGAVVLYDTGPYPWGTQTAIGQISWTNSQWPGFFSSFGQINPGSYIKTSSAPLGALIRITETGTIPPGFNSGTSGTTGPDSSYSPFIAEMTLTTRTNLAPRPQVSASGAANTYIAKGLDLFYDFRGITSLAKSALPNLSTNDPTFAWSTPSSGFSPVTTGFTNTINAGYFSQNGLISLGFPPGQTPHPQVVTTPYSKSLTAFTIFHVFEHGSSTQANQGSGFPSNETALQLGSGSTGITIQRNGTTTNSWEVKVGSTTVGPFTLATDGACTTYANGSVGTCAHAYAALVVSWDGTNIKVYSSPQIPKNGYTLPLTTLATGTYTGTITGTLYLGATNGTCCTNPFYGTMADLLIYSRQLLDPELVTDVNVLRTDMLSRGVTLP